MKKLLQNKIALIVLTSIFVALTLLITFFCVRPTAVGYTYKGDVEVKRNQIVNYSYHFKTSSKLTKTISGNGLEVETEHWYFEHNERIVIVGLTEDYTKEEFKARKQEIIENWDETSNKKYNIKINAFYIEQGREILLSVGSIVTISILAVLDITTLVFAIISLVKISKSCKQSKNAKKI